jgi:two-component system phosphate regulon response regulator PhoB
MNVLLVEPDQFSAEVVMLRLGMMGCPVRHVRTVDEAITAARAESFGLILTELKLDGDPEGGHELLRRLEGHERTRDVPVVLHSIYALVPADVPELKGRVAGLLPKPFRKKDLQALVRQFCPASLVAS